jgi:hypothetical protein
VSGSDAFLAIDKNKNGKIDSVNELFGGLNRRDGFAKLAEFDSNGDGQVDQRDDRYSELLLWKDKNVDGFSDDGEISLASVSGLDSISANYGSQDVYQNRNLLGEVATAVWQGKAVDAADVYFRNTPGVDLPEIENCLEVGFETSIPEQAFISVDYGMLPLDAQVHVLVQVMAGFSPASGAGDTPLYQSVLTPVLAISSQ